ncbi:hypothetical protein MM236_01045 [Belliella sp. DSM 107340]|uniref:Uncharacterized protein n=1 Tax=Belliella calami TaxID=2923436 RepID=A0ABS9UIV2_9BACT|nr:hypothetical protein [Belliella calami]MCH7396547.1 hypothetical protein [Belliella calami]
MEQKKQYCTEFELKQIWINYCKSGKKPIHIPSNPEDYYKDKGWISWEDFMGKIKK